MIGISDILNSWKLSWRIIYCSNIVYIYHHTADLNDYQLYFSINNIMENPNSTDVGYF